MKRLLFFAAAPNRQRPITQALPILFLCFALLASTGLFAQKKGSTKANREFVVLKVYHAASADQLATVEQYLQASLLPALGKGGFNRTGVFTAINNDTAADKKVVVLIPFRSLSQLEQLAALTERTLQDSVMAKGYTRAAHNQPSFSRVETVLLHSFTGMPVVKAPPLKGNREERVYELRSYESATEPLHLNKVKMFNEGEVELFDRLGFNAVFYGQVIAGSRMPNLMYMTSFESKASRDEHWKAFGSDPEWKKMSAMPEYQNNVSKIDITFLRPTAYSKL
ncbi:MAG: NIPSNAP family protein [Bacteroidota bacterium]|nr:NIPSNAP family protein [Bacteroidota bacterium]